MGYTPRKTVYRIAREQLHLNKAKLWRSKFPCLDQWKSCLACQPFVSSCRFYWVRAILQNIRYSGVNCALGPSKSIRYSGVRYSGVCFHIFYCNSAWLSNVVRYNGVFVTAGFVIAGSHCNFGDRIKSSLMLRFLLFDSKFYFISKRTEKIFFNEAALWIGFLD